MPGKRYKKAVCEVNGQKVPVKRMVMSPLAGKKVPLLDMPMMSDIKWQRMALENRLRSPEPYEKYLNEDVPAVIRKLEAWLAKNDPEYTEWRKELAA